MFDDCPLSYPLTFRAGASLTRTFSITDDLGVPIDTTGWASEASVRVTDRYGVPTGAAVLQAASTFDSTAKSYTLDFPVAVSQDLPPSSGGLPIGVQYVWDWKLTTPTVPARVYVLLAGVVTVLRKATV